MKPNIVLKQRY